MTVLGLKPRVVRTVLVVAVVADLLALVGFAFHRTTTVTKTVRPLSATSPAPAAPAPSIPPPAVGGGEAVAAAAGASRATGAAPAAGSKPQPQPRPSDSAGSSHSAGSAVPSVRPAKIGDCPIPLAKPSKLGGVQSLVSFAPAFGPFSAEAFAAASAYQPVLELLGPLLAAYPKYAPAFEPLIAPLVKVFAVGSRTLFGTVEPAYAPHRTKVLAAETQLATELAPYAVKLAGTPLAGCIVDVEAAIVGDTSRNSNAHSPR